MPQPHKGEAYEFYIALTDFKDPSKFKVDPVIATGDFKISKGGGALANLATTPVVSPAGSFNVKVNLSAVEMTGTDKVSILARDVAGENWKDKLIFIDIPDGNAEKSMAILLGNHTETRESLIIRDHITDEILLNKRITGSLLSETVTLRTEDA